MLCTTSRPFRSRSLLRRWKFHSSASSFVKANRYRLFSRSRAVLSFADVVHLLANELTRLGRGCLTLAFITLGSFYRFFFWHRSFSFGSSHSEQFHSDVQVGFHCADPLIVYNNGFCKAADCADHTDQICEIP